MYPLRKAVSLFLATALLTLKCISEVRSSSLKVRYVSAFKGSTDSRICGASRENPCRGLATLFNESCTYVDNTIIRLLPGQHILPVFASASVLEGCANFSVEADVSRVTLVADPNYDLNVTFNRTKYHRNPDATCGLEYAPAFFGKAAIIFSRNRNVLLRGLDLDATQWSMDVFLLVDKADNFTIESCRFPNLPSTHRGIGIFNPKGSVLVKNSLFQTHEQRRDSPSYFNQFIGKAALYVLATRSYDDQGTTEERVDIVGCEFVQTCGWPAALPTLFQWQEQDSSSRFTWCAADNSHLLRIDVDGVTENLNITVQDSVFYSTAVNKNCTSLLSAVSVLMRCKAQNNTVTIASSNFSNFIGLRGSAIQVTSSLSSLGNHVELTDLVFSSNGLIQSTQDGGSIFFSVNDNDEQPNTFNASRIVVTRGEAIFGSAISMRRGTSYDPCQGCLDLQASDIKCNFQGSLLKALVTEFIVSALELVPLFKTRNMGIRDAKMEDNIAEKGTIYSSKMSLDIGGYNQFLRNDGGVIFSHSTLSQFIGMSVFENNTAERGGAIALLSGSSISLYNAYSLVFDGNRATEHGGAIYADAQTTSLTYGQALTLAYINQQNLICFIQTPYVRETAGKNSTPSIMTFKRNLASLQGNDIYAYSFALCPIIPILPEPVAYDLGYRGPRPLGVTNYTDHKHRAHEDIDFSGLTDTISTSSDYLIFQGATCACVKRVHSATLLMTNCSHGYAHALFLSIPELNKSVHFIHKQLPQFKTFAGGVADFGAPLPPQDLLFPWAGSFASISDVDKMQQVILNDQNYLLENKEVLSFEWQPSNIVLMPSPGEQFFLHIGLVGQLLANVSSPAYIQLKVPSKDQSGQRNISALIRLNQLQLAYDDKIVFIPNRANVMSIVGLPGAKGEIQILAESQIINKQLLITIPFQLSPCPLGHRLPEQEILAEGKKITPGGLMAGWRTKLIEDAWSDGQDPLSCNCVKSRPIHCSGSGRMVIDSFYWAGNVQDSSVQTTMKNYHCMSNFKLNSLARRHNAVCLNGTDVTFQMMQIARRETAFVYGECLQDFCKDENQKREINQYNSTVLSVMNDQLSTSTPCRPNYRGLLCGQCASGRAVTPFYLHCEDCSGATPARVVVTTFILGALLFVITILFTWGVSAELVSVLFFAQATTFVATSADPENPHGQEYISKALNLDWSFGMCLTDDLDGFSRLAWGFITPLYLLFLLLTAYILSNFKALTKIFARRNCVRMFWLVILLAYGSLARTSFKLLKCITIQPKSSILSVSASAQRLADNPDTECYHGQHLTFAVISWCVILLVLLPLLLSLPLLHRWPRFKPFSDVYASIYQDDRRWWPGVDLLRRLLLAVVFTEADGEGQYIGIVICCLLFLTAQALLLPFKRKEENWFETLFLTCLTLIAVLAGPRAGYDRLAAIQVIFFVPIFTMIAFCLYRLFPTAAFNAGKMASEKLGIELTVINRQKKESTMEHTVSVSKLRDPLLADEMSNL